MADHRSDPRNSRATPEPVPARDPSKARLPPKRYPLVGFGVLAAFVLTTLVLQYRRSGGQGQAPSPRLEHASQLPEPTQRAFVMLARDARRLGCLAHFDWDHPDAACRDAAMELSTTFDDQLRSFEMWADSVPPPLAAALDVSASLAAALPRLQTIKSAPASKTPDIQPYLVDLALRGNFVASLVDRELKLDAPAWDSPPAVAAAEPAVVEPTPPVVEVDAGVVEVDAGVVEVDAGLAAAPVVDAGPAVAAPEPIVDAGPVVVADAGTPAAPVAAMDAGAAPMADAGSVVAAKTGPSPLLLWLPLNEVASVLIACGKNPAEVAKRVPSAREKLDGMDPLLTEYRELKRPPNEQVEAMAFARRVDQARGKLLRAAVELQTAARLEAIRQPDGMTTDPFIKATVALDIALSEVHAIEIIAATAP